MTRRKARIAFPSFALFLFGERRRARERCIARPICSTLILRMNKRKSAALTRTRTGDPMSQREEFASRSEKSSTNIITADNLQRARARRFDGVRGGIRSSDRAVDARSFLDFIPAIQTPRKIRQKLAEPPQFSPLRIAESSRRISRHRFVASPRSRAGESRLSISRVSTRFALAACASRDPSVRLGDARPSIVGPFSRFPATL